MSQVRLKQHATSCGGLTFLNLPQYARLSVYANAGLGGNSIDLNLGKMHLREISETTIAWQRGAIPHLMLICPIRSRIFSAGYDWWSTDEEDCGCTATLVSLLLVSKQVKKEVEAFVYERNSFIVCRGNPHGLERLGRISIDGLGALTSLTIRLDGRSCVDRKRRSLYSICPYPIEMRSQQGRVLLEAWEAVVKRLARFVTPRRLTLSLILGTTDMDSVKAILEPLRELPLLKHCAISVQRSNGMEVLPEASSVAKRLDSSGLSRLVRKTLSRVTQTTSHHGSTFRYLDLPPELRFRILEYTELVSTEDIDWNPVRSKRVPDHISCGCEEEFGFEAIKHVGGCVCRELIYDSIKFGNERCCRECRPSMEPGLCFCLFRTFNFSTSCVCSTRLHPLLLVSQRVRQDAIPIYYSRNRFVILPYGSPPLSQIKWDPVGWRYRYMFPEGHRSELSIFISSIPPYALQHIRWLEWVLPAFPSNYLQEDTIAWRDYLDTLQVMSLAMNLTSLTLSITMSEYDVHGIGEYAIPVGTMESFERVITPVHQLHGLKDCFIYLRGDFYPAGRVFHEGRLERFVMGSGYDSSRRGKPAERFTEYRRAYNKRVEWH
ncbi:hypothetical protein BCR34DRAFT_633984 [Clohesyomyces aquaticus]|uniref:Uncharacterized protein n=1 Tax=Clohesyomyces aquaticus TaxID=1231657 RepID=A0A1Y1Z2R9_9PLEO|nr:hypothetical protein BCR34DRAFT_633984 [Clohesyomyces aquaticus]